MLTKGKTVSMIGVLTVILMFSSLAMAGPPKTSAVTNHTIAVTNNDLTKGKITPVGVSGLVSVPEGQNKLFTIRPKAHYQVETITVDDVLKDLVNDLDGTTFKKTGNVYKYTFPNVTTDDHGISATFVKDSFVLSVSATGGLGTETITSSDDLITCGSDCDETYDYGTVVTLTATTPEPGSVFEGWSGACKGKNTTCTVTVKKAGTAIARFTKTYTLAVTIAGSGTVKAPKGLNSGFTCTTGTCTEVYKDQKVVTLVAKPDTGIGFSGWTGDASGSTKSVKVTMADDDKNITATFGATGAGMKIAEKVSVVDTTSGTSVKALKIGRFSGAPDFPADSDYNKDQTQVYVNERSAETFKTINQILCMIGQTKYDAMLNQGNYKAQIDKNLCSSSKDDPSSAGQGSQNQSSGSTAPKYEMWTVNSSRADDNSPQILKAWIHEPKDDRSEEPGKAIFAKVTVTEPVTETNPYGIFTLYFKMYPEIDGTVYPVLMSKGIMKTEIDSKTGKVLLGFAEAGDFDIPGQGHETNIQKATLDRAADGSSGGGTAYHYEDWPGMPSPQEETFDFAFNPTNFLRTNGTDTFCLDRTDFNETAWSYGLYDSDGARINRNSAFSIKTTQGGKTYYGSIGYYGIWFPSEVTINNGDPVYKMDFGPGGGTAEPYNVLMAGGKLKKHVRKEMTLGVIKNVPLDYWNMTENKNYRVKWDGTDFVKVQWLDQSGNNPIWKNLVPTEIYSLSALQWDMLNFYSQSLGGNVQIKLSSCTPQGTPPSMTFSCSADDSLPVVFYAESAVFPGDTIPTNLACFGNCPDLTKINSNDPMPYDDYGMPQVSPPTQYASYSFDSANMVLTSGTIPVVTTSSVYQFGIMSGPLFDPTPENLALLACDWDGTMTCGWQAWNKLDVYYTWETGPNDWNKFTALVKDGTVLKFDPPLQVSYVHAWDDLTTSTFNLEYSGFGNLWGIPGKCIDRDTGIEADCGPDTRWIPEFSIAEGSQLTDVSDGATPYYVKPLEEEQRMKQLDGSACSSLTITTYPLPDINQWQDPNIGSEPVVDGPPAVIGGVLQ